MGGVALVPEKAFGAAQIGGLELGAGQLGIGEIGAFQIGVGKIDVAQFGAAQIGADDDTKRRSAAYRLVARNIVSSMVACSQWAPVQSAWVRLRPDRSRLRHIKKLQAGALRSQQSIQVFVVLILQFFQARLSDLGPQRILVGHDLSEGLDGVADRDRGIVVFANF